ncbi:hypothetical protein BBAD15_g12315 [Beauveria bassiana D1-5]|uniref:Uncharacterized protein n=1 Tax=Beauveria bassiana D1-5 TaxID=1245745 RepID=A0A0A2V3U0_BEABA|nr:hypothetical protein BBAD15_g12315 [Beauveria bassiana D1-5]
MAPNLSKIKLAELEQMIVSKLQGEGNITEEAIGGTIISCSTKTVQNRRSNILRYGTIDVPRDTVGRPKKITDNMWLALEAMNEVTPMNQQSMANFPKTAFHYG